MSQQRTQIEDTGQGILTGTDPKEPFITQQELAEMQQGRGQSGQAPVVVNVGQQGNGNGENRGPQGQRMFTEEEVGAIRAEEKEKLYGRLQGVESELETMRRERAEREAAIDAERQRLAEEQQAAEEAKMDVRQLLDVRDKEWQDRFSAMEAERERDRAIYERERELHELSNYRNARLEQEGEYILPELRDLIVGTTAVEIDQAIEVMKQRTGAIIANVQGAITAQRGPIRGVAPTGAPPIGPMEQQTATQNLSAEDIRKMDNKTFAIYRDQLLGIASRQGLRKDNAQ